MNIDTKLRSAITKSVLGRYSVYAVQFLSMVIMARYFTPTEFGIFAIVQVFSIFFSLLGEMGLVPALVNQERINEKMRDSVFTLTFVFGLVLCSILYFCSPIISNIYNNDIYKTIIPPVSISIIFTTLSIVPLASLQKERRFLSIAYSESLSEIVSLSVVLFLFNKIDSILLLSMKPLIVAVSKFIFLYLSSKKTKTGPSGFLFDFKEVRKIMAFSGYQSGFNFINYFSRNLDNLLVGKFFSASDLGIYDKSYQIMRYPLMLLTFAMSPAIQPVLTIIKNDIEEFERLHNKIIRYLSIIGVFIGGLIYIFSDDIVYIILGEQWSEVSGLLSILALSIPIQVVLSSSGGFYQASGRVDLLFQCGIFSGFINCIAIIVGVSSGSLEQLCYLLFVSYIINFFQCYFVFCKHVLKGRYLGFLKGLLPAAMIYTFFIMAILKLD
ncbi:lipopolysaccharide biosynthesis protein [Vibrio vulnificus]|uniref:lipopolysaccharide biosynthesis protein n=1 Tax=Vibrio vulnificus TaxID=672 RepID=UPI003EDB0611